RLTVRGTAPAGSTVSVGIDTPGGSGTTVAGADGTWSYAIPVPVAEGRHVVSATASGASVSLAMAVPYEVTVDLTPPTGNLLAPLTTANATPTVVVARPSAFDLMAGMQPSETDQVTVDVDLNHDGRF